MKKLSAALMGLCLMSAAGIATADEASLQNQQQELNGNISRDQTGVNQADGKMGQDQGAINHRYQKISAAKKDQRDRYRKLLADRAALKDAKARGDEKAEAADRANIREDHHALYRGQRELDRYRARRDKNIGELKKDRGTQEADVKKLDSNEQKLDKTDAKIADKKQDSVAQ